MAGSGTLETVVHKIHTTDAETVSRVVLSDLTFMDSRIAIEQFLFAIPQTNISNFYMTRSTILVYNCIPVHGNGEV